MDEQADRTDTEAPRATEDDGIDAKGRPDPAEGADGKDEASRQGNTEDEDKDAKEEMRAFEQQDELPSDLKEWPDGKAKFITFGDADDAPYGEGASAKLGPQVVHHDDGSVSADGEKVDNPDDYKGEPIPLAVEGMDAPEVKGGGQNKGGERSEDSERSERSERSEGSEGKR